MNMQHVEYILTLASEKNFSKAAEQLFMTQSALSQYVRKKEQHLGITIFNRGNGPITLTPEGELYVKVLQKVKLDYLNFQRQLADLTELRTGKLVIGISSFRATHLLPRVIKEFIEAYPGIELEIVTDNVNRLKASLESGKIDFCIENDYFEKNLFHCESLYTEAHYLAVPGNHPISEALGSDAITAEDIGNETPAFFKAAPVSLDRCENIRFIGVKPGSSFYKCHSDIYREARFTPQYISTVDNIETAFRWADEGIAVAIIPDSLIFHCGFKNHLNYYKLDYIHATQNIVFAMRIGRDVSAATKKFLEMLRQLIGYGTWNIPH